MSVPVRGTIRSNPEEKFTDRVASEIGERLIALEKAVRTAGGDSYLSPSTPPFGGGQGPPGAPGAPGTPGVTDHGNLTGLEDPQDHPQFVLRGETGAAHVHGENDVLGLENRFVRRTESVRPTPHIHPAQDIAGLEGSFIRRGESVTAAAHKHVVADIADHNLWEMMLWQRVFGG